MTKKSASVADGFRGYFEDAAGTKWTVAVGLLMSSLVTLWTVQMLVTDDKEMPLSAGQSALQRMGIELPGFLARFIEWVSVAGLPLVAALFIVTLLLALRSSYQRFGNLYHVLSWMSLMTLFEATGAPLATFSCLLGATAGIALLAYFNSRRIHNRGDFVRSEDSYFGQKPPLLVFVRICLDLFAPLALGAALFGVVRAAFSFDDDEPFRLSRGFAKHFAQLEKDDPKAAEALRLEVLLRASESDTLSLEMKMIVDHVLSEPAPTGAISLPAPVRAPMPPRPHSMEQAMRNGRIWEADRDNEQQRSSSERFSSAS